MKDHEKAKEKRDDANSLLEEDLTEEEKNRQLFPSGLVEVFA